MRLNGGCRAAAQSGHALAAVLLVPLVLVHVELDPDALPGQQVEHPLPLVEVRRVGLRRAPSGVSPAHSVPTRAALKPCRASQAASFLVNPVGPFGGT